MASDLDARIEAARKKAEQAKARLQALEAKANAEARKLDTRRKVILGGLLIDAAEKDERFARALIALLERISRDQDRKAFEGWDTPSPNHTASEPQRAAE